MNLRPMARHVDPNDPTVLAYKGWLQGAFKQATGYLRQFWLAVADADAAKDAASKAAAASKVVRMNEACEALHKVRTAPSWPRSWASFSLL